jgi:hypothetical protein
MSTTTFTRRELAYRANDGIEVSLYWDTVGDTLSLEVFDAKSEERFEIGVPRDRALDAFRHPYAYLGAAEAYTAGETLAA